MPGLGGEIPLAKQSGREMMLADLFTTVRTPYWNDDVIRLAHDIEYSALTNSWQLNRVPDMCAENKMHAHLLLSNPDFVKIPIAGVPVSVVYKGKTAYELYRFFFRSPRRLFGAGTASKVPIQDWKTWMNSTIKETIDQLIFAPDSLIRNYFSPEFLAKQKEIREPHWLGKLASVEIMLREIDSGWRGKTVPPAK